MSRSYRVEIEVKPVEDDKEEISAILNAFCDHGIDKDTAFRSDGVLSITGEITLTGGMSEAEKHESWKEDKALKGKRLTTRWLCWDYVNWHTVIEDDAEGVPCDSD